MTRPWWRDKVNTFSPKVIRNMPKECVRRFDYCQKVGIFVDFLSAEWYTYGCKIEKKKVIAYNIKSQHSYTVFKGEFRASGIHGLLLF